MKASNFSDAQKAFILKQGDDGVPVAEICRKAGIRQATYFNWRKKYAGLLLDAPLRGAEPRSPQAGLAAGHGHRDYHRIVVQMAPVAMRVAMKVDRHFDLRCAYLDRTP
jgi:hypothetical protein